MDGFSNDAGAALDHAVAEAQGLGSAIIAQEHILLGLLEGSESDAARVLQKLGVTVKAVRDRVTDDVGYGTGAGTAAIPFGAAGKQVIDAALARAESDDRLVADTRDLLWALAVGGDGVGAWILRELGVSPEVVQCAAADRA